MSKRSSVLFNSNLPKLTGDDCRNNITFLRAEVSRTSLPVTPGAVRVMDAQERKYLPLRCIYPRDRHHRKYRLTSTIHKVRVPQSPQDLTISTPGRSPGKHTYSPVKSSCHNTTQPIPCDKSQAHEHLPPDLLPDRLRYKIPETYNQLSS